MKIDVYSPIGERQKSMELPMSLFGAPLNKGLMHQAVMMQQGNRRNSVAHVRHRGEIAGSTKKLYQQKHTGQARRGSIRSPLLKGGGKSFGPRSNANFSKNMPKAMRHAALRACLSLQATKEGAIVALEAFPETMKTKEAAMLLKKLPVQMGRRILVVAPASMQSLIRSTRNIPGVKAIPAAYLNPEDVLMAHSIVFLLDGLKKAEEMFGANPKKMSAAADAPFNAEATPKKSSPKH